MPSTNKVVYGDTTLIDLTSDTATEADVMSGKTFHKANGELATGTASTGKPEQSKTVTATTSQQTVTPDSGYTLSSVIVDPQIHNQYYRPTENNSMNDMGVNHNKRYIDTSDMYEVDPASVGIFMFENGEYDVKHHATAFVEVPPTPTQSKTITATISQQTVTPDSGYALSSVVVNPQSHSDSYTPAQNTSSNDMGANHNKRYVNTSGMYIPSGTQSIIANGTYDITTKASVSVSVGTPDFTSPSLTQGFNLNSNGNTYTIAVTQKPKWILLWSAINSSSAAGRGELNIYDVTNNKYYYLGKYGSGYMDGTSQSSFISSISSSQVIVTNKNNSSMTFNVAIYY